DKNKTKLLNACTGDAVDSSNFPKNSFNNETSSTLSLPCPNTSPHFTNTPSEEEVKLNKFLEVHGFRWYQVVVFLVSVLTYLADVVSDAYLVFTYYAQGDYFWSVLTMIFMIVPALLMSTFSLTWYFLDNKVRVDPPRSCRAWTFRLIFHGLQLAPLVRSADAIYYGIVSRRPGLSRLAAAQYTQLMLYEDADCAMLRMIECFTESAPQLLLQLYIILTQTYPIQKYQVTAQFVSCAFSWFSLAWSLTYYQSALRSSRIEKANMPSKGLCLFVLWKAGVLLSRLLALGVLAAVVKGFWFTLALCMHWLFASGWLITRGTTFCSSNSRTCREVIFDFVLGAVYCFDVVNIREGASRLWYLSCYLIIGIENILCACLGWWWWSSASSPNSLIDTYWWSKHLFNKKQSSTWISLFPAYTVPIIVICSFFIGIIMMAVYYTTAHPSGEIRLCIPCDELMSNDTRQNSLSNEIPVHPSTQLV
ncbi:unnamed protein product, partial [Trichobilharzia regenti]